MSIFSMRKVLIVSLVIGAALGFSLLDAGKQTTNLHKSKDYSAYVQAKRTNIGSTKKKPQLRISKAEAMTPTEIQALLKKRYPKKYRRF